MNNLEKCALDWGIEPILIEKLKAKGYNDFFSVQKEVIPLLIRQNSSYFIHPRDLCVSAPTGSGKTLAYAIPIVDNLLKKQSIVRLRALILLPSRELAVQVYQVFHDLVEGTKLNALLVTSSTNLQEEKIRLVGFGDTVSSPFWDYPRYTEPIIGEYGTSLIDILVATPGKLLDHLQFTKGFTLEHLRFLILDEADRLLGNAYHGWVRTLVASAAEKEGIIPQDNIDENEIKKHPNKKQKVKKDDSTVNSSQLNPPTPSHPPIVARHQFHLPLQRLLFSATLTDNPSALALLGIKNPLHINCKDLYQADKASGGLVAAELKSTAEEDLFEEEIFELPQTLIERTLLVETKNRLLKLFGLLLLVFYSFGRELSEHWENIKQGNVIDYISICEEPTSVIMIFVNSVDASHRLTVFLQLLNNQITPTTPAEQLQYDELQQLRQQLFDHFQIPNQLSGYLFKGKVAEMTRLIKAKEREDIITAAMNGEVSIIVSSDRMARGIDLPKLKLVINYDLPKATKTYIHRAGRTSRAGREGMCLSLVKKGQMASLQKIRDSIGRYKDPNTTSTAELQRDDLNSLKPCYMTKKYLDTISPFYDQSIQILPSLLNSE